MAKLNQYTSGENHLYCKNIWLTIDSWIYQV